MRPAGASGAESSDFEFVEDYAREGEFGSVTVLDVADDGRVALDVVNDGVRIEENQPNSSLGASGP